MMNFTVVGRTLSTVDPFDIGGIDVSRITGGVSGIITDSGSGLMQLFCISVSTKGFWDGFDSDWLVWERL